jgi:hypothetical protein
MDIGILFRNMNKDDQVQIKHTLISSSREHQSPSDSTSADASVIANATRSGASPLPLTRPACDFSEDGAADAGSGSERVLATPAVKLKQVATPAVVKNDATSA